MSDSDVETGAAPPPAAADVDTRLAARAARNTAELRGATRAALTTNTEFLNLPGPANAQLVRQVQALTRQTNALIRLVTGGDLLTDDNPDGS